MPRINESKREEYAIADRTVADVSINNDIMVVEREKKTRIERTNS